MKQQQPYTWVELFAQSVPPGVAHPKKIIGSVSPRVCRFCDRSATETTFRKQSHVIPAAFGNRMLFSYEECDDCNHAGSQLESDLASFLSLPRAIARIPSRKGFPKIKSASSEQAFAQIQGADRMLYVYEPTGSEGIRTRDDGNGNIELTVRTPTHRPLSVARALGRMAMFSYPRERAGFNVLRDWVRGSYDWFPVPLVVVQIPVPRGTNTQTVGFWCHSYTRAPGRNVLRFFFVYSTFCTIVPMALDRRPLPDGLPLVDYPQPVEREMMEGTSVFSIESDFIEPEGEGKALISYAERVKVASLSVRS